MPEGTPFLRTTQGRLFSGKISASRKKSGKWGTQQMGDDEAQRRVEMI
jgi:hypothetical protein